MIAAAPHEVMIPTSQWEQALHRIAELEQENSELKQEKRWQADLFALPYSVATAEQKLAIASLYPDLHGRGTLDEIPLTSWQAAKCVGMSTETFLTHIAYATEHLKIMSKRLQRIYANDGTVISSQLYLAPTERLSYPRLYESDEPNPERGGKRANAGRPKKGEIRCKKCGSGNVTTYYNVECRDCHHIGTPEIVQHHETEPEIQVDFSASASVVVEEDYPEIQVDFSAENNQLDVLSPYVIERQVDYSDDSEEIPSSSPVLAGFPDKATEDAAIALFLDIAGVGQSHIKMNRDEEDGLGKYTTIHRALHRGDVLSHFSGSRIRGATLRQPLGVTRAICFDADNSEEWCHLVDAAIRLKAAGFLPILQPSPARDHHVDGGHLWIVCEKLVDIYSACQTMIEIAPMLAEVKEHFPEGDNRVRLPGGKYVRPGVNEWCHLFDADMQQLSTDGVTAALALLQMQTPACLIKFRHKNTELVLTSPPAPTKSKPNHRGYLEKDVSAMVIAEFNATHSWDEIAALAGGFDKRDYFPALWRGDGRVNAVYVHADTNMAVDYGSSSWLGKKPMDKHQVWCFIQGGTNWEAFKREDMAQRCAEYRRRNQEQKSA